jgi:two-component system CheB/CheR fusion protein
VGEFANLFAVIDRKSKLYQRKDDFQGAKRAALDRFLAYSPAAIVKDIALRASSDDVISPLKLSMRELTERALLGQVVPVGALVNGQGDVLYLHGRTGMYLEPAPGDVGINNILKMAREGLQRELTTALHKASLTKERVSALNIQVKTNGHFTAVNLSVCPVDSPSVSAPESPLYLVLLDEAPATEVQSTTRGTAPGTQDTGDGAVYTPDAKLRIDELTEELHTKEEYLRAANEELETSNEELKSSNEEMQSVNEELQSTNEELETSKEELQSINEELATVNTELQSKVADLSRANNDMNNLLAGTGIGTIFVDHQLNILRFTPAVTRIINLILSDVGRPVGHIVSNLVGYDTLIADTQSVLKTLQPIEADVQTIEGKFYSLHILPYRTLDNVIEGAVITFVDITDMVLTREALRKANDLLHPAAQQPE